MIKKTVYMILIIGLIFISIGLGKQHNLMVARMEFAEEIEDREPVGVAMSFPDTIPKVYCFTEIKGAEDSIKIHHVWHFENMDPDTVGLMVKSSSWRTWSSKEIMSDKTGTWRVEVLAPDGKVLQTKEFNITSTAEMEY